MSDGIEALRKLCGGHGYSDLSGLPELSKNYLALATLEGTQQILEPQAAKFLLQALKGMSPPAGADLGAALAARPRSHKIHLAALQLRVA